VIYALAMNINIALFLLLKHWYTARGVLATR